MGDLLSPLRPEREAQKQRLYAAASRYAKELPKTRGKQHRQCYELMRSNLLAALRT